MNYIVDTSESIPNTRFALSKTPNAIAILNPKQADCNYPFKELSGCGVGFKLIQAFCEKKNISFEEIMPLLDLLVVSIAADIVPIVDENRLFSFYGLKQINSSPRNGIKALMEIANNDDLPISVRSSSVEILSKKIQVSADVIRSNIGRLSRPLARNSKRQKSPSNNSVSLSSKR